MEEICRPVVPAEKMILGHDTLIALYSVTFGKSGVVVIGGTGSVAFGRNKLGKTATVGGWGYLMGDEGSAYWIALQALSECTTAEDSIHPYTSLTGFILKRAGVSSLRDLHYLLYSGQFGRPEIAGLAVAVSEAAKAGDRAAKYIIETAGWKLAFLATAVIDKLKLQDKKFELGCVGGVFRAGPLLTEPFATLVLKNRPGVRIVEPKVPAAVAAALLALEQIGIAPSEYVIAHMNRSLPDLGALKQ
jgi:N-acetylglucosamine kinase